MGCETTGKLGGTSGGSSPPGQGNRQTGGGQEDEFDRLVVMLELIRKTLGRLVEIKRPVIPSELQSPIYESWPRASESLRTAIATLQNKQYRPLLKPQIEAAGFTGEMLDMKETSLNYHMGRVDKAILTYNNNETKWKNF